MEEWRKQELLEKADYIFRSKTKYADELKRLVAFYNGNLDKAPPVQDEKPAYSALSDLKKLRGEMEDFGEKRHADMQRLEKMCRKLYEKQTGQKWRPSLTVVPNCGKAKVSKSQGRHRPPILTVIQGGGEVMEP